MKQQNPLSLSQLGGVGMSVVATLVVGFGLGLLAARFLNWNWAVPAGIVLGFLAGIYAMYRQLSARM